jgi:two-component system cell cycle sensor histidine kinase/response regulator CckA
LATSRPDPLRLEALLDAISTSDSLESALRAGVEALAGAGPAQLAAVFLFDEGRPIAESWHPHDANAGAAAPSLRVAAREAVGLPLGLEEAKSAAPAGLIVIPLEARATRLGAVCLIPGPGFSASHRQLQRVVRAIAGRSRAALELARARALQARYERWFRTLDEQVRVLDRERQKFAAIVHASDAAVFVTDLQGQIRWTNTIMAERAALGVTSWIGLSCQDACRRFMSDGNEQGCGDCPMARSLRENAVVHREYRHVQGGQARSFYLSALPIRGPHGRPEESLVTIQDLSDLEILRASEARYRLLFERSGKAIVMVEPATLRVVLANPMASRMTGHDPERLLSLSLEDLHPPSEWPRMQTSYADAIAEGTLGAIECQLRTRDDDVLPAVVTGAHTDLDGRHVLMLEFQDMTEARRVQEALRIAEERLRTVVAASPIILFAMDRDGVITLSEGRGLSPLGLEPGQVVGQSVFELYRDHPQIPDAVRRTLGGEEVSCVVQIGGVAFDTSYAPMRTGDGEIVGVIGVATDVTERRQLEEQLRQAQRMEAIGRLAGGVAHDFNNLLAAMMGHAELMMNRLESGHPLRHSAEEIRKAAGRGAMLTRQLLAFGRKEVLSLRVLDLNAVVKGMDAMLRRLIGEDIQLETIPAPRAAPVRADRAQIEQVILNLAVNARDAMPQGGRLTIEVSHVVLEESYAQRQAHLGSGAHIRLAVTDSGLGMDAETMAHVFEPFFTTKEPGKGTGLGLASVYAVVEQAEGHVKVASEPGMGARFEIYLPKADESALAPDELTPGALVPGGAETVLLVEDEDAVRATAREALESSGYTVIEARNGVEALEVAKAYPRPIHLLISDVVMPHMGGGELAQKLAAVRPGVRVLFISGYPDDALVEHGVAEQGCELIPKPFALSGLTRKVREILDAPAAEAA